ncbi:NAD(P)H-hydrate epimerase [Xinfangfangia pollutisoli]|uniref:NAD(P)H-hydrate epimerase n=1 Tax=Xinfangfangia pollutisoli TaxID=2865960 RepID=UPI001CD4B78E|nr:NAD(P)H-hydrate epimerase [Xinfangfangia pollutisoli]
MVELLTAAQMRAVEAAAIASGAVTGLELMERAGRGVVEAIFAEWPDLAPPPGALPRTPGYLETDEKAGERERCHRAVVLCGPGNNGGDGFVVARLLKGWGWEVEVFLYGDAERLPPDARVNYERWRAMGEVRAWPRSDDETRMPYDPWASSLIVDAVFGTGLTRPIPFNEANIGSMLPEWDLREEPGRPRIVAVDVPSGLCADSGRTLADSDALWADLTVTFHSAKLGHFLGEGEAQSGKIKVASIGLEPQRSPMRVERLRRLADKNVRPVQLVDAPSAGGLDKGDGFSRQTHKYSHGHALILSGPPGRGGAARLAARGALRIGAGLVTVGCAPEAMAEHAARLDAVMLRGVADGAALAEVLEDRRINALCLGPGMGTGAREAGLVAVALGVFATDGSPDGPPPPSPPHAGEGGRDGRPYRAEGTDHALPLPPVGRGEGRGAPSRERRSVVLDADALTILSRRPDLFAALHDGCVLTPHAGEFARLFPDIAEKLAAPATKGPAYSKVDAAREAAARAGCVVLFKGPDTVIAAPDGCCAVNSAAYERAAPWLATAGSGDVLAGFIAGLLARGFGPFDAACTAAWLHVECARSFGPGLIAEDLPEELLKVFRALGL